MQFTGDASLRLLYHGAKKSKMTKNSNQGVLCVTLSQPGGVPPPPQYLLKYLKNTLSYEL